ALGSCRAARTAASRFLSAKATALAGSSFLGGSSCFWAAAAAVRRARAAARRGFMAGVTRGGVRASKLGCNSPAPRWVPFAARGKAASGPKPVVRGLPLRLQEVEVLVLVAEHRLAVHAQPAVEDSGVDAAEVGVVLQIAGVQVAQAGVLADRTALDARAGHEQARAGAVVGAGAAVLVDAPAELGVGHPAQPLVVAARRQVLEQEGDAVGDVLQELLVRLQLARVRVEAVDGYVEDACAEALLDQPVDDFELLAQRRAREPALGAD